MGVHIAQSYGVRVQLLGISPKKNSQSDLLLREADTTTEWDGDVVSNFLSLSTPISTGGDAFVKSGDPDVAPVPKAEFPAAIEDPIKRCARKITTSLSTTEAESIVPNGPIPKEIDGRLLTIAAGQLGRYLEIVEMRQLRELFKQAVFEANTPHV